MDKDELTEKYAETVRKLIETENAVQNYRMTWLTGTQALLFTALFFSWEKATVFIFILICTMGILVGCSSWAALHLSDYAFGNLSLWTDSNLKNYNGPPIGGFRASKYKWLWAMPSRVLPITFVVTWLTLFVYGICAHK